MALIRLAREAGRAGVSEAAWLSSATAGLTESVFADEDATTGITGVTAVEAFKTTAHVRAAVKTGVDEIVRVDDAHVFLDANIRSHDVRRAAVTALRIGTRPTRAGDEENSQRADVE